MMMTSNNTVSQSPVPHAFAGGEEVLNTRFGEMTVDTSKAVFFPKGLLGIPDRQRFALVEFPSEKLQQFRVLQSLDDVTLSLVTLPLDIDNAIIAREDIDSAAKQLDIASENLGIILVVNVQRSPDKTIILANCRAPIFIDVNNKIGMQYVFPNDKYKVQHVISG